MHTQETLDMRRQEISRIIIFHFLTRFLFLSFCMYLFAKNQDRIAAGINIIKWTNIQSITLLTKVVLSGHSSVLQKLRNSF